MRQLFRPLLALFCALSLSSIVSAQSEQRPQILVETTKGNFIIELFNETPVHRDNYLKLVRQHAFDGVQFHRVIKDFMIQAGNLKTRGLSRGKSLPGDSDEATIKAEIMPEKFVHVRGYIGAAREGDDTNPKKKSSFSQFYIVTGKYYTDMDLDEMEAGRSWKYTPEQREAYKLQGGAAHLDGGYTVFGRLLDGWGTVDKIQRVETDDNNRPLKNVIIKRMRLYTPKK